MNTSRRDDEIVKDLIRWADRQDAVRVVLLTSSRANPDAPVDAFSDYDVVLGVRDIHPFVEDRSWLDDFGDLLVSYWDPITPSPEYGVEQVGNVIQYRDGLHIDFSLWPVELLQHITEAETLPDDLDDGYRVLLDKDGLTAEWSPPTYTAYIPEIPTEETYQKVIEDFLSDVPYVAKSLLRDELMPAKWCLDFDMRYNFLQRMLEWRMELDHDWSEPAGVLGRGLKRKLPPALWAKVEKTYAGAGVDENWDALFNLLRLFREVGIDLAEGLGYAYPHDLHRRVTSYAQEMRCTKTGRE